MEEGSSGLLACCYRDGALFDQRRVSAIAVRPESDLQEATTTPANADETSTRSEVGESAPLDRHNDTLGHGTGTTAHRFPSLTTRAASSSLTLCLVVLEVDVWSRCW